MKKILTISVICFFVSCSTKQNFIYYKYKNTTISRLDKDNHIFFFYGKVEDLNNLPKSHIEVTYSGFDGLIWGYLMFTEKNKVEIKVLEGDFYTNNENCNMKIVEDDDSNYTNRNNKENKSYDNILEFRNVIKAEVKVNKINNSQVKAIYPKE